MIGIKFNNEGQSIEKSCLLVDEEDEVTDIVFRLKLSKIEYSILSKDKSQKFKTRKEQEIEKFIKKQLINETNLEKLKYLYFDCFNQKEDKKEKILTKFNYEIDNNWDKIYLKIYNFFKLLNR